MPNKATFGESAASVVGVSEVLHFLGAADIETGQKVLINGAGGSIGTAAVQYARSFGRRNIPTGLTLTMLYSMWWGKDLSQGICAL